MACFPHSKLETETQQAEPESFTWLGATGPASSVAKCRAHPQNAAGSPKTVEPLDRLLSSDRGVLPLKEQSSKAHTSRGL